MGQSLYADVAYAPWVIRARDMLGVELPERIAGWLAELDEKLDAWQEHGRRLCRAFLAVAS